MAQDRIEVTAFRKQGLVRISGLDHWPTEVSATRLPALIQLLIRAHRELHPIGGGQYGRGFKARRPQPQSPAPHGAPYR